MPSLGQLHATYSSLLVLDAASARIQVGDGKSTWVSSLDEAGVGVFTGIEQLGVDLDAVDAFVFCDGPGSVLGIRTVAMAIRTWCVVKPRPVYSYCSLAVVAHGLGNPALGVIADARREAWHHFQLGGGLRRIPATELTGELLMPDDFRHWSALPPRVSRCPYLLAELFPRIAGHDLFHPTDAPDAFLHEEPSYVGWTPKIHRAPGA
jgi:tRNA threonylcarbamoyladenosine biosynthesis protein TsaB